MIDDKKVAIVQGGGDHAKKYPHPSTVYPEYPHDISAPAAEGYVYELIRNSLYYLGFDNDNFGSRSWNSLKALIQSGDTVLIKPNLICESRVGRPDEWQQIITSGDVIAVIIDYVYIALNGSGRIIIADGPQTDSDFDAILQRLGLKQAVDFYKAKGLDIQINDLRRDRWLVKDDVIYERVNLIGDPEGYVSIDLGERSEFKSYALNGRFYGADYDIDETASFHSNGRHMYILCQSVLNADVVINVPKLKTHKKTGVTLSLKNMVGINGYRNCLPHFTIGTPDEGGDEFPTASISSKFQSRGITTFKKSLVKLGNRGGSLSRMVKRLGKYVFGDTEKVIRSGNWYGNDTVWRMVLDLNKILFHFQGDGTQRKAPLRYLTIVDGIIAGDGNGPVAADPRFANVVISGLNPVAVDTVCSIVMGFDYQKISVVSKAWVISDYPIVGFSPEAVQVVSNIPAFRGEITNLERSDNFKFVPHFGWKNHIEHEASGLR